MGEKEDARARQKGKRRGAEVGDPAGEEYTVVRTARRDTGIHPDMIDRHQDHDDAPQQVDGNDPRRRTWRLATIGKGHTWINFSLI
jgi:hypothetical protein